jgi:hypothetical protein
VPNRDQKDIAVGCQCGSGQSDGGRKIDRPEDLCGAGAQVESDQPPAPAGVALDGDVADETLSGDAPRTSSEGDAGGG